MRRVKADKAQCLAMHVPAQDLHQLLQDHAGTAPPRPKAKAKGKAKPAASIATASTAEPFEQPELEADKASEQEQESDESLDSRSDSSSEQDKKVLGPENSGDCIESELCEAAEDSTTAKEQEDEALPTRRRRRDMNSMPKSEPKRTRDVPIEITFSEECSSWFRRVTSDITEDLPGLLRMYGENSDIENCKAM